MRKVQEGGFSGALLTLVFLLSLSFGIPLFGSDFQLLNPLPQSDDLFGVFSSGEITLAVGAHGRILYSRNRRQWEIIDVPVDTTLRAVARDHGIFVVVGDGGLILSSPDGMSWEALSSPAERDLSALCSGSGGFVAVGEGGAALFSPEGAQWSRIPTPVETDLNAVVWTGSSFVAVGDDATLLISPDGRGWVQIFLHLDWPMDLSGVAAVEGMVLIRGSASNFLSSRDLSQWTLETDGPRSDLLAACHGEFVVPGATRPADSTAWLENSLWHRDIPAFRAIACTPEGLIGVGLGGQIAEGDGLAWRLTNSSSAQSFKRLVSDGEEVLAVTENAWIFSGSPEQLRPGAQLGGWWGHDGYSVNDLATGNGMWLIAGEYNLGCGGSRPWVAFSTDAQSWEAVDFGEYASADGKVSALSFDGHSFRALIRADSNLILAESDDGVEWQLREPNSIEEWNECLAADGVWILKGGTRGIHRFNYLSGRWNPVWTPEEDELVEIRRIVHDEDFWLAVGTHGVILTSPDALVWQRKNLEGNVHFVDAACLDGICLVIGSDGRVREGSDAGNWRVLESDFPGKLTAVYALDKAFLLLGERGLVLRYSPHPDEISASFTWRPAGPLAGESISFFNLSTLAGPHSSSWSFGDGSGSNVDHPLHEFENEGVYTVSLDLDNAYGHAEENVVIEVGPLCSEPERAPEISCPSDFPSEERFSVSWDWDGIEGDRYFIEESAFPDFSEISSSQITSQSAMSFGQAWFDSPDWYYRVSVLRDCPGALRQGPESEVCHVHLEATRSSAGKYVLVMPYAVGNSGSEAPASRTDLQLLNPGEEKLDVALFLLDGDAGESPIFVELSAGASRDFPDLMAEFDTSREASGVLIGSDQPLIANAVVRSGDPRQEMGMAVPLMPLARNVPGKSSVHSITMVDPEKYSTSISMTNPSGREQELMLTCTSPAGEYVYGESVRIPPYDTKLIEDLPVQAEDEDPSVAAVKFKVSGLQERAYSQSFLVDKISGDMVSASPAIPRRASRLLKSRMDLPPPYLWSCGLFAEGRILLMQEGLSARSRDGLHWERSELPEFVSPESVVFSGQQYLTAGCGANLLSDDGISWRRLELPGGESCLRSLIWDGRRWMALGGDNRIFESPGGENWDLLAEPAQMTRVRKLYWTGELYLLLANGGIWISSDGIHWGRSLENSADARSLSLGDEAILAKLGSYGENFALSRDGGRNWQYQHHEGSYWYGSGEVIWTGSSFAVGGEYTLSSTDGSNWSIGSEESIADVRLSLAVPPFALEIDSSGHLGWIYPGSDTWVLPSIARIEGSHGRSWSSMLGLRNTGESRTAQVDLRYQPRGEGENSFRSLEIPAQESLIDTSPLENLFETSGTGSLRMFHENDAVYSSIRISSEGPRGPVAQLITELPLFRSLSSIEAGWILHLATSGSDGDPGWRTNLGLLNTCESPEQVHIEFFRRDGSSIGNLDIGLEPGETRQLNDVFHRYSGPAFTDGYARLSVSELGLTFMAWASVVRDSSSDAVLIPAVGGSGM